MYRQLVILALIGCCYSITDQDHDVCKKGWIGDRERCYFLTNVKKQWNDAKATKRSCKELKAAGFTLDGLYWINTNVGVIQVYCDMTVNNGGWTYLPASALGEENLNLKYIFTENNNVLLRIKNKHTVQTYTEIEPLNNIPLDVKVNSFYGYTKPINVPKLSSYLFLGILPKYSAKNNNIQGFKSNGKPITFRNCDKNPNSLFAFYPNFHNRNPISYHSTNLIYEKQGVSVNWRKSGQLSVQQLPDDYFFFTELHFGGCGTYTSSDRWVEADGTAIGLR